MSEVLITGGAGFIGLHLARHLAGLGLSVDLLDNFQRGRRDADLAAVEAMPGVRLIAGDMSSGDLAASLPTAYRFIFHFAALLGVQNVLDRPYHTLVDNIALTHKAIEIARRQSGLRRFVFASTSEVYAGSVEKNEAEFPTPEGTPLSLTDPAHPRTSYMLSKICGESMCHYSGLPVTIIRPHNVYGPRMGMSHVIPQMLERAYMAADGDEFPVYSPTHTRTFCYVEDAVRMIGRVAEADAAVGCVLNIGAEGPEIPMHRVAETVIGAVGRRLRLVPAADHAGSPRRRCPDMSHTTQIAGCVAAIGLEEGVLRTFDWYRRTVFSAAGA